MGKTFRRSYRVNNSNELLNKPINDLVKTSKKYYKNKHVNPKNDPENVAFSTTHSNEPVNVSNKPDHHVTNKFLFNKYGIRWQKNDVSMYNLIDNAIKSGVDDGWLKMCKKQLDRRGKLGMYNPQKYNYKHNEQDIYDEYCDYRDINVEWVYGSSYYDFDDYYDFDY